MAQVCKMFNTPTNNIQTRITRVFTNATNSDKTALPSVYGALEGNYSKQPCMIQNM